MLQYFVICEPVIKAHKFEVYPILHFQFSLKVKQNKLEPRIKFRHVIMKLNFIFQSKTKNDDITTHDETSNDRKDKDKKRTKKEGKDRTKNDKNKGSRKKPAGPMHFTANNEPRALEVLGDLDPSVFEEVIKYFVHM